MSAKNLDGHGRFRSQTIAFRLSPEENEQINFAVSLSGMTKQDYITHKLLDREIHVQGNSRIHKAIFDRLDDVLRELKRIENGAEINDELMDNIKLITGVIDTLYLKK